MKALFCQPLLLLVYFVFALQAKVYERCELAKWLDKHGMDGYEGYSLANWICMAFFVSGFDTEAVSQNKDGTSDFGIFQINSGWWCATKDSPSQNLCRIDCKDLLSADIENDILCAKKIARDPQGMAVWNEWKTHCENRNLTAWMKGCHL